MSAKYSVVQYVPDPVADERMNVGVIVWDKDRIRARFLQDWRRARWFGAEDIEFLREVARTIEAKASPQLPLDLHPSDSFDFDRLEAMIKNWNHCIQFTMPRGSIKDADSLADEVALAFLREPAKSAKRARSRRFIATAAARALSDAVRLRAPTKVDELVHTYEAIDGEIDHHTFPVVLRNGKLIAAAQALSFEMSTLEALERDIYATAFALDDVRKKHRNLSLSVCVLPPSASASQNRAYRHARQLFDKLHVEVVPERKMKTWAKQTAEDVKLAA